MGMNMYGYIGAYVTIPEVKHEEKSEIYRCSSNVCRNHKYMNRDFAFCPICGASGEEHTVIKVEEGSPSYYSFAQEHGLDEDALFSNDSNQLQPNKGYHGISQSFSDRDDSNDFEITVEDITYSITAFKDAYKEFLDKFKEVYGIELEVKYGVVTSYG
jgi:hypothetical protein